MPAPGILANDSDAAGDPIRPHIVTLPAHGTLRSFPDGSFTYKPSGAFEGLDSFTYEATDGGLASPIVTVSLYVTSTNRAPVEGPETYTVFENSPWTRRPRGFSPTTASRTAIRSGPSL
ncbi:MAG: Ig-like domain-containing protein [Acidimicrobiales bacterium]